MGGGFVQISFSHKSGIVLYYHSRKEDLVMAFCPKCGHQIPEGTHFCSGCGAAVNNTTQNQTSNNQQYAGGMMRTPVKTDYSLGMFILLTIITCGIYGYYIVYKLAQDVNQMCAEDGDKIGGLAAYILLSFVTCGIYNIYWLYKIQNRMHMAAPRYNVMVGENGSSILLWYILGLVVCSLCQFVGYNIIFKTANKLGMAYNAKYFH